MALPTSLTSPRALAGRSEVVANQRLEVRPNFLGHLAFTEEFGVKSLELLVTRSTQENMIQRDSGSQNGSQSRKNEDNLKDEGPMKHDETSKKPKPGS